MYCPLGLHEAPIQNPRRQLKILGAKKVPWCKFHTEDP
jgi:hypothetical protein